MTRFSTEELTDKEELYAQLRAVGKTKTKAAAKAYPDSKTPGKLAYEVELRPKVLERIRQLQEERAEAYGLDPDEQIRKYHEIYHQAMDEGKLTVAMQAMARIDAIGGFETRKSEVVHRGLPGGAFKDEDEDFDRDLEKFKGVLKEHKVAVKPLPLKEERKALSAGFSSGDSPGGVMDNPIPTPAGEPQLPLGEDD